MVPYEHEPFTDFSLAKSREEFSAALKMVESEFGKEYPLIIGGRRINTDEKIISENPAKKEQIVGLVSKCDQNLAEKAMEVADHTFKHWKKWDPEVRAEILFKAAAIVRRRKHEFSAYLVYEAGKPWREADADTAEAIDFLEYYGRQIIKLNKSHSVKSRKGERNKMTYIPLGVGVVISPWNFAFAIMAGMTSAALVSGNTVLLKPASTTPVIAYKFMEVLEEAGLPDGVVNYIPGSGGEIGDYLIDHRQTRFISFTGSRDVGIRIYERAAKVQKGQFWLKRVIAEMGGKDTIIVDASADLDLAAKSIVQSAFGFSGQKCSACSRAVIHEKVYEPVLKKTIALTKELTIGEPVMDTFMGPVNDQLAFDKVMKYISIGKNEGRLMAGGTGNSMKGYFITPTIFADVNENARIMQEEIFGPIVAFCKAKDFNHALEIANNTEYGLTGSVISNDRQHIEQAQAEFHAGNLYINRGCTGAIVGYQPFGGFNMSGTDSKAGGPDYLLHFTQAKTISEQW